MKQEEEKTITFEGETVHHQKAAKCIVFDLNKTLFMKKKQRPLEIQSHGKVQGQFIYLRPYLKLIGSFIEEHQSIKVIGWTTMQGSKRATQFLKLFQSYGVKFDRILHLQHCIDNQIKDLKVVQELYNISTENCILIDDSEYKRSKDQNFICIKPYKGNQNDQQLLDTLVNLDKFIKCQNDCLFKKIIKKELNLQKFRQNQQRKQYKLQSSMKKGSEIKSILFDVHQSLLFRTQQPLKDVKPYFKFKKSYLYFRPHISKLIQFLSDHKINVFLWIKSNKKTIQFFQELFKGEKFPFKKVYSQEDASKQDITTISEQFHQNIDEFVVVDEKSLKKAKNPNCIQMNPFKKQDMENEDILSLMMELDRMMGCKQDCMMKKI